MGLVEKLTLNRHGLSAVLSSSEVRALVKAKADAVAGVAIDRAPVASGDYKASIHVEIEETDRVKALVVADSDHAAAVEFRTRNLGGALDAAKRS